MLPDELDVLEALVVLAAGVALLSLLAAGADSVLAAAGASLVLLVDRLSFL